MHDTMSPSAAEAMPWELPEIDDRPAPMVPAEVDCRTFPSLMLDMHATRSLWWITTDGPAFKAGITLMVQSWSELPAGTLPKDDRLLAHLTGMSLDAWRVVKDGALAGWALCADDRYHHPEVAKRVMASWGVKMEARKKAKTAASRRWSGRSGGSDAGADDPAMLGHSSGNAQAFHEQCSLMPPEPAPETEPAPAPETRPAPEPKPEPQPAPEPQPVPQPAARPAEPAAPASKPDDFEDLDLGGLVVPAATVRQWVKVHPSVNVLSEVMSYGAWMRGNKVPRQEWMDRLVKALGRKERDAADNRFKIMADAEARAKAGNVAPSRRRPLI